MKRLIVTLLILIPSLAIAAQLFVQRLSLERVRPVLERELSEALGLAVRIEGPMRASLIPWLRFEVEDVVVANLPDRPSPSLLAIRSLDLELRLLPLLREQFVFESLEIEGVELRVEPDAQGAWPIRANLDELDEPAEKEDGDSVQLALRRLEMRDLKIYLDSHGWSPVKSVHVDEVLVAADDRDGPIEFSTRGAFEGGDFEIAAVLGSPAEMANPTGPFPVRLDASVIEGSLEVEGTVEAPRDLDSADLRFEAILMDPAARARELGFEIGSLGSLAIEGRLVERNGALGVDDFSLRSRGDGPIDLVILGRVADVLGLKGVDLSLDLSTPDASLFEDLTTVSLPNAPLELHLEAKDEQDELDVQGEIQLARKGVIELSAVGAIEDLMQRRRLDVRVGLESATLDVLADALGQHHSLDVPPLGPVRGSGSLLVGIDGTIGLDEIDLQIGEPETVRIELTGSVENLLESTGVDLVASVSSRSVRRLAELFDLGMPEVGGLEAVFALRDLDGSLGLEGMKLELGKSEVFDLSLVGEFDDLREQREIELGTNFHLRDLSLLAELTAADLPELGPIYYSAEVSGSLDALESTGQLRVRDTVFDGAFDLTVDAQQRPRVDFRVHSPLLNLTDLVTPTRADEEGGQQPGRLAFDLATWWNGSGELPLDWIRALDANLEIAADRVVGYELLDLQNVLLSARLDHGRLVIEDATMVYESGRVGGRIEFDARTTTPRLDLDVEAFNVDLTTLTSQFREGSDFAGVVDVTLDLTTQGSTADQVRSNLNGVAGLMLRDGAFVGDYSRALTFNVLRVSLPKFSFGDDIEAPVQCLLVLSPINSGVAKMESLYLEGGDVTISGTGQVDLVQGEYDLRLRPRLHRPGLVGIAATVEVAGPLGNPDFRARRGSMVTSALGALWSNALRPVNALDRLIRGRGEPGSEGDEGPCDLVVEQRVHQMRTPEVERIDLERIADDRARERADRSVAVPVSG